MRRVTTIFLGVAAVFGAAAAQADEDVPLWEAGMGAGVFSFPAYRGSSTVENYLLPVPYFVYHGDFFKSDRRGVRGDFVDSGWVELSIAVSASPPTRSDNIPIREGMPDLKPTAEVGPELDVTLWKSDNHERAFSFRLPVREAFTLESSPRSVGVDAFPHLAFDMRDLSFMPGWNVGLLSGPLFGTRAQNGYFYNVAPAYATPTRPAYTAAGGYAGTEFLAALSKRYDNVWIGAFVRYDTLAHATFENSPLVVKRSFVAAGFGVSYIFARSEARVTVSE